MTKGNAVTANIQLTSLPTASVRAWWLTGVALVLVAVSSLAVVHSSHACRELYAKLQVLEAEQWYLQEDYSRLLLEESTWASHHRVEKVATDALGMQPPPLSDFKVVEP